MLGWKNKVHMVMSDGRSHLLRILCPLVVVGASILPFPSALDVTQLSRVPGRCLSLYLYC